MLSTASVGEWLQSVWTTVSSVEALKDAVTSHSFSTQTLLGLASWAKDYVAKLWDPKWFGIYVAW